MEVSPATGSDVIAKNLEEANSQAAEEINAVDEKKARVIEQSTQLDLGLEKLDTNPGLTFDGYRAELNAAAVWRKQLGLGLVSGIYGEALRAGADSSQTSPGYDEDCPDVDQASTTQEYFTSERLYGAGAQFSPELFYQVPSGAVQFSVGPFAAGGLQFIDDPNGETTVSLTGDLGFRGGASLTLKNPDWRLGLTAGAGSRHTRDVLSFYDGYRPAADFYPDQMRYALLTLEKIQDTKTQQETNSLADTPLIPPEADEEDPALSSVEETSVPDELKPEDIWDTEDELTSDDIWDTVAETDVPTDETEAGIVDIVVPAGSALEAATTADPMAEFDPIGFNYDRPTADELKYFQDKMANGTLTEQDISSSGIFKSPTDALQKLGEIGAAVVADLSTYPEFTLSIDGHTSAEGSDDYNLDLSMRRARWIQLVLSLQSVDPAKVVLNGYGEKKPVTAEEGLSGEDLFSAQNTNRRVEFGYISKSTEQDDLPSPWIF